MGVAIEVVQDIDRQERIVAGFLSAVGISLAAGPADGADKELRLDTPPNRFTTPRCAMREKWGAKKGVKENKDPELIGVYVEKNDRVPRPRSSVNKRRSLAKRRDWGPSGHIASSRFDAIEGSNMRNKNGDGRIIFTTHKGQNTVVADVKTSGFDSRTDLVEMSDCQTLDDLVEDSKKLKAGGQGKFGYVGGMAMNHTWVTWFGSSGASNCDASVPVFEEQCELAPTTGNRRSRNPACARMAEFWWAAINTHKISPRGIRHMGTVTRPMTV